MRSYIYGWKRGFDFTGRSTREEFWGFILVNLFVTITLWKLDFFFNLIFFKSYGYLSTSYAVVSLVPVLALHARRLCDINKSFGYILLNLVPIVGSVIYLIWMLKPSANRAYYPKEKHVSEAQMKNRIVEILLFFIGVRTFNTVVDTVFRQSMEFNSFLQYLQKIEVLQYYQVGAMALLNLSLVFIFKEKKFRVIGFVLVGIYTLLPFLNLL